MQRSRRYSSPQPRLRVTSKVHFQISNKPASDLPRNHSRVDLWKRRLSLHVTRSQMSPRDITAMMQRQSVSLCAFMPDRMQDTNAHSANQKHFGSLSQMLSRNNLVSFKVFRSIRVISGNFSSSLTVVSHDRSLSHHSMRITDVGLEC